MSCICTTVQQQRKNRNYNKNKWIQKKVISIQVNRKREKCNTYALLSLNNTEKKNTIEKRRKSTKFSYLNSCIFLMQNKFIQLRLQQQQQGLTAENALCKFFLLYFCCFFYELMNIMWIMLSEHLFSILSCFLFCCKCFATEWFFRGFVVRIVKTVETKLADFGQKHFCYRSSKLITLRLKSSKSYQFS